MTAKETRRVDILCYRVSLSQKLLNGRDKYQKLNQIVDEAVSKLEADVGPLTGIPVKMGRGIVNRLSSGPEVQRLCASALELLDSMLSNEILHPLPKPVIQDSKPVTPDMIRFEDVTATSLTVLLRYEDTFLQNSDRFTLWHRKAHDTGYLEEPTCTLFPQNSRFIISGLMPATVYQFKIVYFDGTEELGMFEVRSSTGIAEDEIPIERSHSPATNCSDLSNPSSVEDETCIAPNNFLIYCKGNENIASAKLSDDVMDCNNTGIEATPAVSLIPDSDVSKLENKHSSEGQNVEEISTDNGSNSPVRKGMDCVPYVRGLETGLPITPCKLEILKDGLRRNMRSKSCNKDLENGAQKVGEPQDGGTSKKRSGEMLDDNECAVNGVSDRDLEYYVKVIRWLECEGHIERNFRQKFLTWYSLRATREEVRVVKVFVDTFIEDPAALAEQLVDTFSECISNKKPSLVPSGFCMKLWH